MVMFREFLRVLYAHRNHSLVLYTTVQRLTALRHTISCTASAPAVFLSNVPTLSGLRQLQQRILMHDFKVFEFENGVLGNKREDFSFVDEGKQGPNAARR